MSIPLFNWLEDRSAGVLLHPTSLPGSTGIGTLGREARHFIDFLVDAGLKYWQVCPLGPTGFGDSPYQCFSAFAGNPYFIDLETLVGQHYLEENDLAELRRLPVDRVDYGAQWVLRWPILRKAYRAFAADASRTDRADFAAFRKNHKGWLEAYARFIALKGKYDGCSWQLWPSGVRQYSKVRKSSVKSELSEEI
ncbi:MAG TPA: 4-alpha-glucanotransferase, partial [Chthoniobacterales bacterium]